MAIETRTTTLAPGVQRAIERRRAEAERIRGEDGDPASALSAWVRATFDEEALKETVREVLSGRDSVWHDEDGEDGGRDG